VQGFVRIAEAISVTIATAILAGCSTVPPPSKTPAVDATAEPWYGKAVEQLQAMNQKTRDLLAQRKADEAASVITSAEAWAGRVVSVPHPTLAAMEAASDLDELYGRMLLDNRNYGWARMMFQKNLARWRTWKPQTGETLQYLQAAKAEIAECDRRMTQ
jgi:Mg-chelatase subunit ChlI